MKYVYLNMDSAALHGSEEELIASFEAGPELPQMEAIPNLAGTETLIAAGHIPFDRSEALLVYRNIETGVSCARISH